VNKLRAEGFDVSGITCHVGKAEDREKLLNEVLLILLNILLKQKEKKIADLIHLLLIRLKQDTVA
jgi:hypothetical protein